MNIKESNNKYIRAIFGIIPHIVILISLIIPPPPFSQTSNYSRQAANYYANAVTSKDNQGAVQSMAKKESIERTEKIYSIIIPGIVIISDVIIIRYWKKKCKEN